MQATKEYWYKDFTLVGRIFYANLLTPRIKNGNEKYDVLFAWKIGSNPQQTQMIQQFLAQAKQLFAPSIPDQFYMHPLKEWGKTLRQDGKPQPAFLEGCYWINLSATARRKAVVVNEHRLPVIDPAEMYSGRNAIVNLSFYNTFNPQRPNESKHGAGGNIIACMLQAGGEKEATAGAIDVDKIFGQFSSDMGMQPAQGQAFAQQPQHQAWNQAPAQAPQQQAWNQPAQQPAQAPQQQQWPAQPAQQPYSQPAPNANPYQQPAQQPYAQPAQAPQQQPAQQPYNPYSQAPYNPYGQN